MSTLLTQFCFFILVPYIIFMSALLIYGLLKFFVVKPVLFVVRCITSLARRLC